MKLDSLELPGPWQAAILRVTQFPVPTGEASLIQPVVQAFTEILTREYKLKHEVLLQFWKLSPQTGGNVLSANVKAWSPRYGLGVWPDRQPPQGWTEEMLVDAAAAVFRGDEPAKPSHRLLHLEVRESDRFNAATKMRGFGAQIEIFAKDSLSTIENEARDIYLPRIIEERFQDESFYLPLFDIASLTSAKSAEELTSWMCGIDLYLRESPEDKAFLFISNLPLQPVFDRLSTVSLNA